jgi:hypothetical protein
MDKIKRYQTRKKRLRKSRKKGRGGICSCTRRRLIGGVKLIKRKRLPPGSKKLLKKNIDEIEVDVVDIALV